MTAVPMQVRVRRGWERASLATRFAVAAGIVLALVAVVIANIVSARIEEGVVRNSANATAIYMESILSPISQQLANGGGLSPGAHRALDELFANTALGQRVVSYKFWGRDGTIIDSSDDSLSGQTFEPTEELQAAWNGQIMADFDNLGDEEDAREAALGEPLLEIYSPIHEVWSGRVIAVAEFYERQPGLRAELAAARRTVWIAAVMAMLGLGSVLYVIVLGGSRTIEAQRQALDQRLTELADMSARNQDLRLRVQAAAARAAAQSEQTMRRIGADLHDGPAQVLAYAALRLDSLTARLSEHPAAPDLDKVRDAVTEAMAEVRSLSRGLSLPDIAGKPLPDIIRGVAEAHEVRTGHQVAIAVTGPLPQDLAPAVRICVFRFVQEALNNASRHAGGAGLSVALSPSDGGGFTLTVRDAGPGLPQGAATLARTPEGGARRGTGLGLAGLRDRVESLGGQFAATARPAGGTDLTMTLDPTPETLTP